MTTMRQKKRRRYVLASRLQDHMPRPRPRFDAWAWASHERMHRATAELMRTGGDPIGIWRTLAKTATITEWKFP